MSDGRSNCYSLLIISIVHDSRPRFRVDEGTFEDDILKLTLVNSVKTCVVGRRVYKPIFFSRLRVKQLIFN